MAATYARPRARRSTEGKKAVLRLTGLAVRWSCTLLGAALLFGCSLLPLGGHSDSAPGGAPSPMDARLREYRAVVHCHSYLSHDSKGTIAEIAAAAARLGFDVVLLNDHYAEGNIARSPRGVCDGVLFVPGVELRLAGGGSLLALGVSSDFEQHQAEAELIGYLTSGGAFVVAGHVEEIAEGHDLGPFGGFEVYNLHAQFETVSRAVLALRFLFYPIDCFFEAAIAPSAANLARWDRELARGQCLTALAGHDAHANVRVFGPLGGTIGTYAEVFRLFSTRILASELTENAILEALRRGRTFVVFDYLGDGAGFSMRYGPLEDGDTEWAILGDRVSFRNDARFEIRLPCAAQLRLVRDGRVISESDGEEYSIAPPGSGVYRVEVFRDAKLWIVASPIRVVDPG